VYEYLQQKNDREEIVSAERRKLERAEEKTKVQKKRTAPAVKPLAGRILIQQGDLTEMDTDAIVNAANNDLILGGGVAGAIKRKGGEEIQRECNEIGAIPVGYAAMTTGGKLKARFVIHAASMRLGGATTAEALRSSTAHSLRIANDRGLKSIAFPAVGTGIAGFPLEECAKIMLREAAEHLRGETSLKTVHFVLFDDTAKEIFQRTWEKLQAEFTAGTAGEKGA
jgi:O-acetyl-ADP-ribose deacetylase